MFSQGRYLSSVVSRLAGILGCHCGHQSQSLLSGSLLVPNYSAKTFTDCFNSPRVGLTLFMVPKNTQYFKVNLVFKKKLPS